MRWTVRKSACTSIAKLKSSFLVKNFICRHYQQNFYFFMAFSIAIGAYLTYFGFATQPQR